MLWIFSNHSIMVWFQVAYGFIKTSLLDLLTRGSLNSLGHHHHHYPFLLLLLIAHIFTDHLTQLIIRFPSRWCLETYWCHSCHSHFNPIYCWITYIFKVIFIFCLYHSWSRLVLTFDSIITFSKQRIMYQF